MWDKIFEIIASGQNTVESPSVTTDKVMAQVAAARVDGAIEALDRIEANRVPEPILFGSNALPLAVVTVSAINNERRRLAHLTPGQKIHRVPGGCYAISEDDVWRPGSYKDEKTAQYAFSFDDTELQTLQDEINNREPDPSKRVIRYVDLEKLKAGQKEQV